MSGSSGLRAKLRVQGVKVLDYVSGKKPPGSPSESIFERVTNYFSLPAFPNEPKPTLFPGPSDSFIIKKVIDPVADKVLPSMRTFAIYGVLVLFVLAVLFFTAKGVGSRLSGAR